MGARDERDHGEPDSVQQEQPDLALVHADDEYLDLLGGLDLDSDDSPDELASLLMAWRKDVDAEPIGELVDEKLAVVTVQAARVRRRRRPRLLVPIAAAAAVLAVAFAGFGLAARDAQPGDTLWALTKVLYADHARSVEAAAAVRLDLRDAEAALADGRVDDARSRLDDAHAALPTVSTEDGQKDLEEQHASLVAQLPGNPSGDPTSPPPPDPTSASDSQSPSGTTDPTSPSDTSTPSDTTTEPTPTTSETSKTNSSPGGESGSGGETPQGARNEPEPIIPTGEVPLPEAG